MLRTVDLGLLNAAQDLALLRAYEAGCLWRRNQHELAIVKLDALRRDLALGADSVASCVVALELRAAYSMSGNFFAAGAAAIEALVSARRVGTSHLEGMALYAVAESGLRSAHYRVAIENAEAASQVFGANENGYHLRLCKRLISIIEWKRGRLTEAQDIADHVVQQARESEHHHEHWYASLIRAVILTHMGRFKDAEAALREDPEWHIPSKYSRASLLTAEYLADLDLERGRADAALPRYSAALTQALALVPRGDVVAELRRRIAECHLLAGDAKRALDEAQDALALCREIRERYDEAACHRVIGLAHAALGANEAARKAFDQGFADFDEIETPYEWAKLWLAYGDWLASDSAATYRNLSAALEAYRAAFDHFERIGSEYKLGEARARIESLERVMAVENEPYAPTTGKVRPARRPRQSADLLRRSQWAFDNFGMLTRGPHLLSMLEEIASIAVSDLPVLVLGESGTGKELVARGVHSLSGRTGEFMAINCSAVAESMLEGEFFGFMRGAFTNAVADKPGLFEVAHQGTVFLDEIGEMVPDLQSKLLRFLETGVLRRVGATRDTAVDTRIVAATNRERSALQGGHGFRSDLYYRLAHAVYELPPLRERGDDVELLLDHFLAGFSHELGRTVRLSAPARSRLLAYGWPGNVRELRSVVQKLVVAARPDGVITPRDLPVIESTESITTYQAEVDAGEKRRILRALEQARFVKTDAAKLLRISRTTLVGKMKRLGIEG